jgi:hypothetical protein
VTEPVRRLKRKTEFESQPISAKERDELRAVIRARNKALKMGIEERKADPAG